MASVKAYTREQVQSAIAQFAAYVSGYQATWQSHFNLYLANAGRMTPAQRAAFASALEAENASLTRLQNILWTAQQKAQSLGLSGTGLAALGLDPITAIPVALVLTIITALVGAYVLATVKDADARRITAQAQAEAIRASNAGLNTVVDAYKQGNATPDQLVGAMRTQGQAIQAAMPPPAADDRKLTWLPWAVAGGVGLLAFVGFTR